MRFKLADAKGLIGRPEAIPLDHSQFASVGPTNGTSLRISTSRIATGHCATTVLARYLTAVPIAWQAAKPRVSTAKPREDHEVGYCNVAHFAETERAADDADDFFDLRPKTILNGCVAASRRV